MGQITTYAKANKTDAQRRADAERLREFGPKVKRVKVVETVDLVQREADEARLAELVAEHEKGKKMFYGFMKSAITVALRDMQRSIEAGKIALRLGVSNPIVAGVMQIGTGSGLPQSALAFVDAICDKFAKKFRAIGRVSQEEFEYPVGG